VKDEEARRLAYRYLSRRAVTSYQLLAYLRKKAVPAELAQSLVKEFAESGDLNDMAYAFALIGQRSQRYGRQRIYQDLKKRGFPNYLCHQLLSQALSVEKEKEAARLTAEKKVAALPKELSVKQKRRRLYNFLRSRGFSDSLVRELIFELVMKEET
jgi:SOS response regulatory protein OraA/RecX